MTVGTTTGTQHVLRHRLYLTAVVLAAVFALGVFGAQVVVRVHDHLVRKEDMACHDRLWREALVTLREARKDDIARACPAPVLARVERGKYEAGDADCSNLMYAIPTEDTDRMAARCNIVLQPVGTLRSSSGRWVPKGAKVLTSGRSWRYDAATIRLLPEDALAAVIAFGPLVVVVGVRRWLAWLTRPS